jgi:hypothetical protein
MNDISTPQKLSERTKAHITRAEEKGLTPGDLWFASMVEFSDTVLDHLDLGLDMLVDEHAGIAPSTSMSERQGAIAEIRALKSDITSFKATLTAFRKRIEREWKGPWPNQADTSRQH